MGRRAEKINVMLRKKQNDMALSLLRSRKQLEALLKLRLGALETVQTALMKVETAAGDIAVSSGLLYTLISLTGPNN